MCFMFSDNAAAQPNFRWQKPSFTLETYLHDLNCKVVMINETIIKSSRASLIYLICRALLCKKSECFIFLVNINPAVLYKLLVMHFIRGFYQYYFWHFHNDALHLTRLWQFYNSLIKYTSRVLLSKGET